MFLLWVLALGWTGCADSVDRNELPSTKQVSPYVGSWEYRYGDSPRNPDGSFVWAEPKQDDGSWQKTTKFSNPAGHDNQEYLWLRTQLVGAQLQYDTLLLPTGIYQSLEAFVDGRLVTRFGPLEGPAARRYAGKRPIYLPIGDLGDEPSPSAGAGEPARRTLTLRFFSPTWFIGFLGSPLLGNHDQLLVYMVKEGLPFLIIGTLYIVLGLGVLSLYALDRREVLYLLYGMVSLIIGLYELSRSPMRAFILDSPAFWRCTEIITLCLVAASISAFLAQLLEDWQQLFMRLQSWFFMGCFAVGTFLALSGVMHVEYLLRILLYLIMGFFVFTMTVTVVAAWRGSTDWRILATGFLASAALGFYSVLQSLSIVTQRLDTRYYTATMFLGTLGLVLARRFRAFNKQMHDYSTVLQLSFSSSQDLTPGHQAQIALAELLRMLKAEQGLLFLCRADGSELDLVAGRNFQGGVLRDPSSHSEHDQRLVSAVLQKRQPFVRQFKRPALVSGGHPQLYSTVAAPLLARGQLLGVIYLEVDAARRAFSRQDVEILLGLGSQVALTLIATRAGKLESESATVRQRLQKQEALLGVAERLARGDLQSPISVPPSSELAPLAEALEQMRLDLRAKVDQLESSHAAVRQLNQELRFQLDQRLRRLLDRVPQAFLPGQPGAAQRSSATALPAGELLGDDYRIVGVLGHGSSGSVYEVERTADKRHLAAKVFEFPADKALLLRFAGEAQILAQVNHPNVVAIIDVDLTADAELFLVMELVRGVPLFRIAEHYRDQPFARAVLQQIAQGLSVVHERGIVHRDLRPANVLIVQSAGPPQVKLVDFGVSTLRASAATRDQPPGHDPDGAAVSPTGPASDIFSFGVIAYELFSGALPFPGSVNPTASGSGLSPLTIVPLLTMCPELPQKLAELVDRCLHKDPAERPTAKELLAVFTVDL